MPEVNTEENPTTKKETITCSECGYDVEIGLMTCPECGCPMDEVQETKEEVIEEEIPAPAPRRGRPPKKKDTVTCNECGYGVEVGVENCPECGCPMFEDTDDIEAEVKDIEPEEEPKEVQEIAEEQPEEVVIKSVKKKKKKKGIFKQFIFYLFLLIFFIGGCATAVILYDKTREKNEKNQNNETYTITQTLSCVNDDTDEEQNYYFDDKKLVQYSLYSLKTYTEDYDLDRIMTNFRKEWEDKENVSTIRVTKSGYKIEKVLVIDIYNSKDIKLDKNINKDSSLKDVQNTLEKAGWSCKVHKEDKGTKLPLNKSVSKDSTTISSENTKVVNIYMFTMVGDNYSTLAEQFFKDLANDPDYGKKFNLKIMETFDENWNITNENNYNLLINIADNIQGTPYIVVGEQSFNGYSEAYNDAIKTEIERCYTNGYTDPISDK